MWKTISKDRTTTYQWDDEPLVIHITKTGFIDLYIVTLEEPYDYPDSEYLTKKEIEDKFNINIKSQENLD